MTSSESLRSQVERRIANYKEPTIIEGIKVYNSTHLAKAEALEQVLILIDEKAKEIEAEKIPEPNPTSLSGRNPHNVGIDKALTLLVGNNQKELGEKAKA